MTLGEIYVGAANLARRVGELGTAIADDYAGRDPLLVVPLGGSVVFAADLSRSVRIPHELDFLAIEPYGRGKAVRLRKDVDANVAQRDLLIVADVVDTGLTLNYLCVQLAVRRPASLAIATLLDRPYRRLVPDLPVRYVGFTAADELFVGYGFGLDPRYRSLPDLHVYYRGRRAA